VLLPEACEEMVVKNGGERPITVRNVTNDDGYSQEVALLSFCVLYCDFCLGSSND